jgi:threonine dehydratase/serine racemase
MSTTNDSPTTLIDIDDVEDALEVVSAYAHRTPIVTCQSLDKIVGHQLFLKCENLQKVGAFKFRGAINAVSRLTDEQKSAGVITHSSGNHGQALALAAKIFSVSATIVIPENAPQVKKDAVAGYGANVVFCEPTLAAREQTVETIQAKTGATFIPPFNHPHIIAGQGTAALELIQQTNSLDAIVAPVGGGGLISGTAIVANDQEPPIPVFASEPAGADDAFRSKQAGELIPQTAPNTIADGLLTSLGSLTWPFVRDFVEAVITVDDDEIIAATKLVWTRTKMIIEPSCATAVAAVMKDTFPLPKNSRVGIIISGGNVDLDKLPWT